jgi:hypothetical protein
MLLHKFLEWHKLLHIILPVIIIALFQKRLGLFKVCIIIFAAGFIKEIYDTVSYTDTLLESTLDMLLSAVGIALGIFLAPKIESLKQLL